MRKMRFGLHRHPTLARVYAVLVMIFLPALFPILFAIAYAPDVARTFIDDISRNYRDAWRVAFGMSGHDPL